jgi:hypothetical protein
MDVILAILGIIGIVVSSILTYFFTRKKNNSDINLNNANAARNKAEAIKLNTENKLAEVELFDKLNNSLTEQNERLLQSNEKLVKSNETLISQNKKLLKQIGALEERISALEEKVNFTKCDNAPECPNRVLIND